MSQTSNPSQVTGIISGYVTSSMSQKPIPGITVIINDSVKLKHTLGTYTSSDGKYTLKNIPIGIYSVKFSGIGYKTFIKNNVEVTGVMPVNLNIELVENIVNLKGIEVKSSYFTKMLESLTSTQNLTSSEIRRLPGGQEDIIRAAALLPGVGVTQAGRNDLVVRGGAPFENLFIVDNLEVPNINHFGSQGTSGGPLSIINIDFVKDVTFSAGGFGARYGDKTSSLTNISLRDGNRDQWGSKLVLSATGFGLNAEGPIDKNGSVWFSIRRSYLDFVFKAAGFGFIPEYWDLQTKATYKLGNDNSLSFLFIGALDGVSLNNSTQDKKFSNSQFAVSDENQYFSGLTWKHLFTDGYTTCTLGETLSRYNTFQNDSNLVKIFQNDSKEAETILRTDVDYMLSPKIEVTFGNQVKWATHLTYNVKLPGYLRVDNIGIPQPLSVDTNFSAYKNATYASLTMGIGPTKLTIGGRMDYDNFLNQKLVFSPRASFLYQYNEVSAFELSAGRYYQSPSYIWLIGSPDQQLSDIRADQIVIGYNLNPREDVKMQIEAYYKIYADYPARVYRPTAVLAPSGYDDATSDIPFGLEPLISSAAGFSRGLELFVQKKLSDIPVYGLLSISVGESKFTSLEGGERYGPFDARFIGNIAFGWRPNDDWEFSGKFRAATGLPTTPYDSLGNRIISQYDEGTSLPFFHSLDIRVDKRWSLNKIFLDTYIDIQNVYSRKNVAGVRWNPRTKSAEYITSIGIIPSIGVSFEF